jgi:ankyrin repeat protein
MTANTAMIEAVKRGDASAVDALLTADPTRAGAVDEHAKTPLHWAAECDHPEIAALLVGAGADIEAETSWGMTPLQWAGVLGSRGVADQLRARGARLDLPTAAGLGLLDVVDSFLPDEPAAGDVETVSAAFVLACRNGHRHVADLLHRRGADIDHPGALGGRAVHWAAINGHDDVVAYLVASGADLTHRDDRYHATPVDWAREGSHDHLADLLTPAPGIT